MQVIKNVLMNLVKIGGWILLLIGLLKLGGALFGASVFVLVCFIWNIVLTLKREYKKGGDLGVGRVLDTIASTDVFLPFTVYGCYCSPKYGEDGRTAGMEPIDELDAACKTHDDAMTEAKNKLAAGEIDHSVYVRLKNRGDLAFMRAAITSRNSANGIYLLGLEVGFLFRILGRSFNS